ncbi:MAG: hypothetical protein QOD14_2437 [Solirubrobacterales bacterium]|jgi:hypothetical protein|nr:hypothetical protein [Solirubrobacterales bacterium]
MAFHVEISRGPRQRARIFNLDEAELRSTVLDPWLRGRVIELGDKEWEPRDCKLVILEGPKLADADLSMGRGWSNAERASENVTRGLIDAAAPASPMVAILADGASAQAEIAGMLGRLELESAPWAELRARILGPRVPASGPGFAAVLAIESAEQSPAWLFDAGLARGALGPRAVLAQLGVASIPTPLAGVEVMRLEPDDDGSLRALGDRLAR